MKGGEAKINVCGIVCLDLWVWVCGCWHCVWVGMLACVFGFVCVNRCVNGCVSAFLFMLCEKARNIEKSENQIQKGKRNRKD